MQQIYSVIADFRVLFSEIINRPEVLDGEEQDGFLQGED